MIEEQAKAMEKLITVLTENYTCQIVTLIKSTTNAMKEICPSSKTSRKHPTINRIIGRRRGKRRGARGITMHLSASTAERNILPKQNMSAGSLIKTKTPAHPTGSQQKAPEGARGPC
jgi:hypothetical protein